MFKIDELTLYNKLLCIWIFFFNFTKTKPRHKKINNNISNIFLLFQKFFFNFFFCCSLHPFIIILSFKNFQFLLLFKIANKKLELLENIYFLADLALELPISEYHTSSLSSNTLIGAICFLSSVLIPNCEK